MNAWPDDRRPDEKRAGQFVIDPMWHLDDRHSQLARARARFAKPGDGIVIGHLDNGLDGRHAAAPQNLVRGDRAANAVGLLESEMKRSRGEHADRPLPPELTGGTHGLGTIGLLAGSWVAIDEKAVPGGRIKGYYGWLGGAPFATVVPVRVAPWVFSASTGELAYGIDYASRVKRCDIISMSHGGSPTQAWADAVNAAYERGTAIFAAESDFFSFVPAPFRPNGIILPASPVYPAAFRRVLGVTGITADQRNYAQNTFSRLLRSPKGLLDWAFRGSYGADGTSAALLRPNCKPDESQTKWLGQLRPHPVAAYSPNVPWISIRKEKDTPIADGVDLDGAGTSASTPQTAAAAALWLQKHRGEFSAAEWRGWQKSEAVYQALMKSAERHGKREPDAYLGVGSLRADDALNLSYADIRKSQRPGPRNQPPEAPPGSLWFGKAPNDYFDGVRSFWGLFGLQSIQRVPIAERAILSQRDRSHETRPQALERLYFNMMLLEKWHSGATPRKNERDAYWARAHQKAKKAPAPVPFARH
jgi:subtilisin family serine protease